MRQLLVTTLALVCAAALPARGDSGHGVTNANAIKATKAPPSIAQKGTAKPKGDGKDAKPPPAPQVKCEVSEFLATKTGEASIDPALAKHKKALSEPPLSAYDTFKVTGGDTLTLGAGKSGTVKVTAKLDLLFKGVVVQGPKNRLQFEITIDDASGTRLYRQVHVQDSGASLIQSGGKGPSGGQVFFAITCT
jgi:hypothetical protein